MKKVIVIVGPTASGKTGLSVTLAKAFGAEIINGDSVQVYRGLDIGSAKISDKEKDGVVHHLLDIRDLTETYTVSDFQNDARRLIETIGLPMIVGGTGFYVKAALYDYDFEGSGRRASFDASHADVPTEDLVKKLEALDPGIEIDPMNRRRVLRALELALSGSPRSGKRGKDTPLYDILTLYLDIPRDILEQRLVARLDRQIEDGFIREVQSLSDRGIVIDAIGYREIDAMLKGETDLEETKRAIVSASCKLAKKQKTWFNNQMEPVILDALSDTLHEDAAKIISTFLARGETP